MAEVKPLPQAPLRNQDRTDESMSTESNKETKGTVTKNDDDDDDEFEFFHEFKRDKVRSPIHQITNELKIRGIDTEYLFLPFRPEQTNEKLLSFLNALFPLGNGQPVADDKIPKILSKTDVWTLLQALKYIWCRLPKGEIIGWPAYIEFKNKEAEQNYSQKSFLEIMPKCLDSPNHASIVYDFFDLIVTLASNSKKNKMSARKISKMCAIWAFQTSHYVKASTSDASRKADVNGYKEGLKDWVPASEAMFHLLLAFIRSFVPTDSSKVKLPKSLRNILFDNAYPPKTADTFNHDTVLTVPLVTLTTTKFSRKPWQLIERCNELMSFDEPENFVTREDYALLKSLFKKKDNTGGISSKMSKESKRLMKCMSTKHSTFQAGWGKRKNLSVPNSKVIKDSLSISRVDIDDYFIWAWLSTLSYEQTTQKRRLFGRSLILEFEFDGFKKWLILEESDAMLVNKTYETDTMADSSNSVGSDEMKNKFLEQVEKAKVDGENPNSVTENVKNDAAVNAKKPVHQLQEPVPVVEVKSKPLPIPQNIVSQDHKATKASQYTVAAPKSHSEIMSNMVLDSSQPSEPSKEDRSSAVATNQMHMQARENRAVAPQEIPQGRSSPVRQRTTPPPHIYQNPEPMPPKPRTPVQSQSVQPENVPTENDANEKPVPIFTSPYSKSNTEKLASNPSFGTYRPQYRDLSPTPTPLSMSQNPSLAESVVRQSSSTYDENSIRELPVETYGKPTRRNPSESHAINQAPSSNAKETEIGSKPAKDNVSSAEPPGDKDMADLTSMVDDMTLEMIIADPGDAVKDLDASVRTTEEKFETLTMFDKYKMQAEEGKPLSERLNTSEVSVVTPLDLPSNTALPPKRVQVGDEIAKSAIGRNAISEKNLPSVPKPVPVDVARNDQVKSPDVYPVESRSHYLDPNSNINDRGSQSASPNRVQNSPNQQYVYGSPNGSAEPVVETRGRVMEHTQAQANFAPTYTNQRSPIPPQEQARRVSPRIYQENIPSVSPTRQQASRSPDRYGYDYPSEGYAYSEPNYGVPVPEAQSYREQRAPNPSQNVNYGSPYATQREQSERPNDGRQRLDPRAHNQRHLSPEGQRYNQHPPTGHVASHSPQPMGYPGQPVSNRTFMSPTPNQNMPPQSGHPYQGHPSNRGALSYDPRRAQAGAVPQSIPQGAPYHGPHHVPPNSMPQGVPQGVPQGMGGAPYGPQRYRNQSPTPHQQIYTSPPPMQQAQFRSPGNRGRQVQHQSPVAPQHAFAPDAPVKNKLHSGNIAKNTNRKKLYADIRNGNFGI
ncbi:rhoGAP_fMSB1 [Kluyveromyces marxianus DMKU3-1042]|uniref:RhoGAP_fMSB1 n=1 Tax=Kluyveromyces marxianus (strain DMKU3-1042 / BCC 29191 / NBRC 104275) TaxID=1003335 RepID=W0T6Z7_KLUMD|nr:uncharacterized protein KLMA_10232 [Kluyveromyces marxianus DMKU3-1042]BAO37854.1 rhoGAP_fMSB1 [Kluyveromyces marxianus DMKU3-1042]